MWCGFHLSLPIQKNHILMYSKWLKKKKIKKNRRNMMRNHVDNDVVLLLVRKTNVRVWEEFPHVKREFLAVFPLKLYLCKFIVFQLQFDTLATCCWSTFYVFIIEICTIYGFCRCLHCYFYFILSNASDLNDISLGSHHSQL